MIPFAAPGRGHLSEGRFPRRHDPCYEDSNEILIPGDKGIEDRLHIQFRDGHPLNVVVNCSYYSIRGGSIGGEEESVQILKDGKWLEIFYDHERNITRYK